MTIFQEQKPPGFRKLIISNFQFFNFPPSSKFLDELAQHFGCEEIFKFSAKNPDPQHIWLPGSGSAKLYGNQDASSNMSTKNGEQKSFTLNPQI